MSNEVEIKCVYHDNSKGEYQCPKCKKWFCKQCFEEIFLPIDMFFWVDTAKICANCHHKTHINY